MLNPATLSKYDGGIPLYSYEKSFRKINPFDAPRPTPTLAFTRFGVPTETKLSVGKGRGLLRVDTERRPFPRPKGQGLGAVERIKLL